jgi:hypothetical protein
MRLTEARQRLELQQAEAARARLATQLQPPPPALASEPSDVSLSAPVTLNDKQHRTAAALLASLGQTANRGRERLARLERVLNTIAADAAEPQKASSHTRMVWCSFAWKVLFRSATFHAAACVPCPHDTQCPAKLCAVLTLQLCQESDTADGLPGAVLTAGSDSICSHVAAKP